MVGKQVDMHKMGHIQILRFAIQVAVLLMQLVLDVTGEPTEIPGGLPTDCWLELKDVAHSTAASTAMCRCR